MALLWALSLAALCTPLGAAEGTATGWARTLPDTGVWLIAIVALGFAYRNAATTPGALSMPRLWLLAALLAAVATLGESFAVTGTAELVTARKGMALLYFVGRVPLIYMGFMLLTQWLSRYRRPRSNSFRYTGAQWDAPTAPTAPTAPLQPARGRKAYIGSAATDVTAGNPPAPDAGAGLMQPTEGGAVPPMGLAQRGAGTLPQTTTGMANEHTATRERRPSNAAQPARVNSAPQTVRRHTGWDAEGRPLLPQTPYPQHAGAQAGRQAQPPAARAGEHPNATVSRVEPSAKRKPTAAPWRGSWNNPPAASDEPPYAYLHPRRREWPPWAYALLLLVCWSPYLFAVWPGTVSNDSITQLMEIFGVKALSNGNPLAQTGLVWLFAQVGQGLFHSADTAVALYICAQAAAMAYLLGYTVTRMRQSHAPDWLFWLSLAFYALNPIFPTFAFCVGKDTNFAMAVLWFTLMVWRVLESRWPPARTVVGLTLSAAFCGLLRNAGAAVAGVTLLLLLIWSLTVRTKQWRAPLCALGALAGTVLALQLLILPALGALPTPQTENWSVPLQQVARTVASEPLTETERAAIDAALPVDELKAAYNGELSDPVKALWREGVTPEQRTVFFATWLRLGFKHPATYLSATFHNTYGYLLPGYVSTIKPTFLLGKEGHTERIAGLFDFTVNPLAGKLKTALQSLFALEPFRAVTAPGLYGVLTLFAAAALLGMRRRHLLLAMFPALLALLGCLFSAVNGYFRYAMPLYFVVPILLTMLSQATVSGPRGKRRIASR